MCPQSPFCLIQHLSSRWLAQQVVGPSLGGRQPRVTNVEKLSLNFLAPPASCTSHVVVDPRALVLLSLILRTSTNGPSVWRDLRPRISRFNCFHDFPITTTRGSLDIWGDPLGGVVQGTCTHRISSMCVCYVLAALLCFPKHLVPVEGKLTHLLSPVLQIEAKHIFLKRSLEICK